MKTIKLHAFFRLLRDIDAELQTALDGILPLRQSVQTVREKGQELLAMCREMELPMSAMGVSRLLDTYMPSTEDVSEDVLKSFGPTAVQGASLTLKQVENRIEDELSLQVFFKIQNERTTFYEGTDLFGEDVSAKFPSAAIDIEEAGKCLALSRSTACVFHLMRVLEVGLRTLGDSLGDPSLKAPRLNPNWGQLLSRCRGELERARSKRSPDWQADDAFYSSATANLLAVKDAWRNPTVHVEISYDEEKASDVFNAVRAFMRHLATKLSEAPTRD